MKTTHHAFALLGATLLAACQADSNPGNISAGDSPRSGSQWVLVAGQLNGKPLNVQDGTVTLTQEKDAFTGVSAINHYRVPVKIRGGNIEHPEPPTTTLMAGPVEAMRLESDYLEAMSAVKHLKREGDSLTI
ncbi:MAG: META domain-containing protein, partial [Cardiobacterium sp.]